MLQCPFTEELFSPITKRANAIINLQYEKIYRVLKPDATNGSKSYHCEVQPEFQEFGIYNFLIKENGCEIQAEKEGVNIYFRK